VRLNGDDYTEPGMTTNPEVELETYGSYVHMEVLDNDFAANHFPDDDNGDAYKCMRVTHEADLRYEGPDPDPYRANYLKRTNKAAEDYTKLIELTYALSDNTPDATYIEEVNRVLDPDQWLRFLAVNTLLDNSETTLANGNGDDYYMYSGGVDPRFVLIQHDLDAIFGMGDNIGSATHGIFRFITDYSGIPALERLVTHPEFMPHYYGYLRELIATTFSPEELDPVIEELLEDFVPAGTMDQMKGFMVQRIPHVLSLIPSELTIISDLPQASGYYITDTSVAVLYGESDAVKTRSVTVNGQLAVWEPVEARWDVTEPVEVETETIVPSGSVWKYFDQYTDLGPDWYLDFNDSDWPEGPAELGYGDDAAGRPENTTIGYIDTDPETAGDQRNFTTYLSHAFEVADASKYSALTLRILRDDGAIVYLNGLEIRRTNMPGGPVDYGTRALNNVTGANEFRFFDFPVDASMLNDGNNVLAVEIHQYRSSSPDISFDLEIQGRLKDTSPADGVALNPGINRVISTSGTMTATPRRFPARLPRTEH